MTTQDPKHGAHLRLPEEIARLEKAVAFFKESGDEKMLSLIMPQLADAKEHLPHAAKAAAFVEKLGLGHDVKPGAYTYNDAVNVVAKVLREHDQHESGKFKIKSLYHRSHAHLKGANEGKHCDDSKLSEQRNSVAEIVEHLGLTDPAHVAAAAELVKGSA